MALTDAQLLKLTKVKDLQALGTRVKNKIDTLDSASIKGVNVNGTALTATNGVVNVTIAVEKKATANTGYAASYTVKANGVALSPDIDIPKDFLVKDATLETSTAQNYQDVGCSAAGKKYIDFTINTVDNDATATHIYLPVEDLVDIYRNGNGLALDTSTNTFSIKLDSSNTNGLSVGANGLALALANDSVPGAMSAADHAQFTADSTKLSGISARANKTTVTTQGAGTIEIDGTSQTIVNIATDAEVTEMLDAIFPTT